MQTNLYSEAAASQCTLGKPSAFLRDLRTPPASGPLLRSSPIKMQSDKPACQQAVWIYFIYFPLLRSARSENLRFPSLTGFALSKCNLTNLPASRPFVILHFGTAHCLRWIFHNVEVVGVDYSCLAVYVFSLKISAVIGMNVSMEKKFRFILFHQCTE